MQNVKFKISGNEPLRFIEIFIQNQDFGVFHTPLKIPNKDWDPENQRPKNIYLKKYKRLNEKLDALKIGIAGYTNKQKASGEPVIKGEIQKIIEKICISESAYKKDSLLFVMQDYIQRRKDLIRHSTHKRYIVFLNLIKRFEGYSEKRLSIDDIDINFTKDFIQFGKKEQYSENTIYRTIEFVKTILNFLEGKGIRTSIKELKVKQSNSERRIIFLTESEIQQIQSAIVPEELQVAKDWLIISCYTGQRFSDFINFSKENLFDLRGKTCIRFIQKKTQKEVLLPLHPIVLNIIRRYSYSFPDTMNITEYNKQIKQIAKLANFNETLQAKKRIGFRSKRMQVQKWQMLTSHIGRRSFATNFYGKIPTPLLMDATGHKTEQVFLRYINPVHDERIISLGNYFDKIHLENN